MMEPAVVLTRERDRLGVWPVDPYGELIHDTSFQSDSSVLNDTLFNSIVKIWQRSNNLYFAC